jgi:hypothetical protein
VPDRILRDNGYLRRPLDMHDIGTRTFIRDGSSPSRARFIGVKFELPRLAHCQCDGANVIGRIPDSILNIASEANRAAFDDRNRRKAVKDARWTGGRKPAGPRNAFEGQWHNSGRTVLETGEPCWTVSKCPSSSSSELDSRWEEVALKCRLI